MSCFFYEGLIERIVSHSNYSLLDGINWCKLRFLWSILNRIWPIVACGNIVLFL